jgi:putative ABC transport system permease protein
MIGLAWHTARARATSLAGSLVALALGVALLAAMALTLASTVGTAHHPRWFARAGVVVAGDDTVSVTTGSRDDRETETATTVEARAVPPALAARLSRLHAARVLDYAGYASAPGAPGDTVHPWAAASLHHYTWVSGGPPARPGQIVLTAPTGLGPGTRIVLQTADGRQRFTVSGVIRTGAQAAFYATGAVAARGSPGGRIDAVALTGPPGEPVAALAAQARAATRGQPVRVLTGDHRRDAEPDPDGDLFAVAASLLGTTSGLAGFVSVFVVASTFAYAVAARRREFGLLRTAGATPRQIRRLVLGEALAVGVLASAAGGALGIVIAPPFARWLARSGIAPPDFTAHIIVWPVAVAFAIGLVIALLGAWLAARRAGRVRPAEALREAAVDRRPMTVSRWVVGVAALGGSVALAGIFATAHSADAASLILLVAMLLVLGCAMLAPVLIPPMVWLLTVPLAAAPGATGMLARGSAVTAVRRTAATVAPILLTVGFAGSMLAGLDTFSGTEQSAAASRITAPAIVTPRGGAPGLADPAVAAIRAVPGVAAAVPVTDTTVYVRSSGDPEDWTGQYVSGPGLARVLSLPVVAGSLADLTGTGTVAVPAGSWRLGQTATMWLADSTPVKLRVVAVFADQIDLEQTVLLPSALRAGHTSVPMASTVYLSLSPGARLAAIRAAAAAGGGAVGPTGGYLTAANAENNRINRLAVVAILGMALAYTAIAIANTLVMATGDRIRELATLRLSGATPGQVLRLIGVEACLVSGIGTLLAAAVTAATVTGLRHGLLGLAPSVRVVIPWLPLAGIALACLAIAVLASLIPAALALRRQPAELAAVPE